MKRQLITGDKAIETPKQHQQPCSDCPWARTALPGWLGDNDVAEWMRIVHGDGIIECHALKGPSCSHQCAGAAIYRANVCKTSRDPEVLTLPADSKKVFTWGEFEKHHEKGIK